MESKLSKIVFGSVLILSIFGGDGGGNGKDLVRNENQFREYSGYTQFESKHSYLRKTESFGGGDGAGIQKLSYNSLGGDGPGI